VNAQILLRETSVVYRAAAPPKFIDHNTHESGNPMRLSFVDLRVLGG
jgi:hypothetical protein